MNREQALPFVRFGVDNALSAYGPSGLITNGPLPKPLPTNAVLVGWQRGETLLFVAVWSYMTNRNGARLSVESSIAVEIATDLLQELLWFNDNDNPPKPDHVID